MVRFRIIACNETEKQHNALMFPAHADAKTITFLVRNETKFLTLFPTYPQKCQNIPKCSHCTALLKMRISNPSPYVLHQAVETHQVLCLSLKLLTERVPGHKHSNILSVTGIYSTQHFENVKHVYKNRDTHLKCTSIWTVHFPYSKGPLMHLPLMF